MKKWFTALTILVLLAVLTACGGGANTPSGTSAGGSQGSSQPSESDTAAQPQSATETAAAVQKIVIGTGSQFPQVCFIDENGKLTGFDVELLRLIDEHLPAYEFEFQVLDFTNLLLSLETEKIDVVAHQMEKNPERVEKYLFNEVPYAYWKNKIVVAQDNQEPIESLADLHGKKAFTTATSAAATLLENYNKENNNALEIVYSSGTANDTAQQLASGRSDFTIAPDFTLSFIDPDGLLKTVGKPLSETEILYVFRQQDEEGAKLAAAIDGAIKDLRADGTLSKLSIEWLGFDATIEE